MVLYVVVQARRNVILFAIHPLRRYAHLVSRFLSILSTEMHKLFPFIARMINMLGC